MALERTGIEMVAETKAAIGNMKRYETQLVRVNKAQTQLGKNPALTKLGNVGLKVKSLAAQFTNLGGGIGKNVPVLGKFASSLGGMSAPMAALTAGAAAATIAVAGLTAGIGAFAALGARGLNLQPTIIAFNNMVGSVTDANGALSQWRSQTRGTISDMELMRLATTSLAGTSREFREAIVSDFGAIIDGANRIAVATGQSADIVREKFVRGLRLGSKKLVDDLGVIVDTEKAYRDYAESIGVAATALSDSQKQTAFATAAVTQLKESMGDFGEPIEALDAIKIPLVAIKNIIDKLSLAILPAFEPIVIAIGALFDTIQTAFSFIVPLIHEVASVVGGVITGAFEVAGAAVNFFLGPLISLGKQVLPFVVAGLRLVYRAVGTVVTTLQRIVAGIFNTLTSIRQKIFGNVALDIEGLAFRLAQGGGFIIGSFAAGLLRGGTLVTKAVTAIAQIVADFLQGFSPPKMGPLSNIDQGGYNIAKAWAEGFKKGFVNPAEQVAASVNKALGEIADFSKERVESRIAALDEALRPFVESLKIAKSQMEAIAGFVDPALEAIERQRKAALEAFAKGDITADELRELDKQFTMLSQLKAAEQGRVDQQTIQLAIMQAQQAEERALLGIQLERLNAQEEITEAVEETAEAEAAGAGGAAAAKEKKPKEKKPKKGTGEAEQPEGEGAAEPFAGGGDVDLLANEAVDNAERVLREGFAKGIADSGFDEAMGAFTESTAALGEQVQRIAESDPVQGIKDKFEGLETVLDGPLETLKGAFQSAFEAMQSVASSVSSGVNAALAVMGLGFSAVKNVAQTAFNTVKTAIENAIGSEGGQRIIEDLNTAFSVMVDVFNLGKSAISMALNNIKSNFETAFNFMTDAIDGLLRSFGVEGGLQGVLTSLGSTIEELLQPIKDAFASVFGGEDPEAGIIGALQSLVGEEGILGENGAFVTALDTVFARGGTIDQLLMAVPNMFRRMRINIRTAITNLMGWLNVNFVEKFNMGKTLVIGYIQGIIDKFTNFASDVSGALSSLGDTLVTAFVDPFVSAVQAVIDVFVTGINGLISTYNGTIGKLPGFPDIGTFDGFDVRSAIEGNYRGGVNERGLRLVGERGAELVNFGRASSVLNNNRTNRVLSNLQPKAQPVFGAGNGNGTSNVTNNRQRTINATFNNASDQQQTLIMRQLESMG